MTRLAITVAGASACALLVAFARPGYAAATAERAVGRMATRSATALPRIPLLDSLKGRRRKLRAGFLSPSRAAGIPLLGELFGDSAVSRAGVYAATDTAGAFYFVTVRPFADTVKGRIGGDRIGFFPSEQRAVRTAASSNPDGFLEVTALNQDTPISEHFRLRDFLSHDQATVWPKYLVLREPLVEKLELVLSELRAMGIPANRLRVMSGFRTPQYNQQGVGAGGRVQDSRHQYGDAADVYVVNGDRNWNPDLIGGVGIYHATSAHGPLVHIDVRGTRARWGAM